MGAPSQAPAYASQRDAEAAQDLHPREWAMLQTALTNAQRVALMALVAAYTGFQLRNGQFYVVESRVSPYISISFSTFRNYLTDLRHLGLLELVWRSPNQHGDRSLWRMRLDVIRSSGQLAMSIDMPGVDTEEMEPVDMDVSHVEAADEPGVLEDADAEEADQVAAAGSLRSLTRGPRDWADEEYQAAVDAELERLLALRRPVEVIEDEVKRRTALSDAAQRELVIRRAEEEQPPRATRRRLEREARKRVSSQGRRPSPTSAFVQRLNEVLSEEREGGLSRADERKALEVEAAWAERHGDETIPDEVIQMAAEAARERSTKSFAGFMLKVISDELKDYAKKGLSGENRPNEERWGKQKKTRY